MFNFKRAQTATEYLIILASIMIIALMVLAILGEIPKIGGRNNVEAQKLQLSTKDIGVIEYSITDINMTLVVVNNLEETITLTEMNINSVICDGVSSDVFGPGQEKNIVCSNINSSNKGTTFEYNFNLTYTDSISSTIVIAMPDLIGTIGSSN